MPAHSKAALPQDPSAPSGRSTVISMVRNKNNLEDLRLRRIIEDYDKELGFRVKTHDFEKLDTYEFLRNLKACDSDKMSQFKEIQKSIREMPTPDALELNLLSRTFHSLDLHIAGEGKQLNNVPDMKKDNSSIKNSSITKSKESFESRSRFPEIRRAQTEPLMSLFRKKSKPNVNKIAVKEAWQHNQKESIADQPSLSHEMSDATKQRPKIKTKKSCAKKKIKQRNGVRLKTERTSCSSDDCEDHCSYMEEKPTTEEIHHNEEPVLNDFAEITISPKSLVKYPIVREHTGKIAVRQTKENTQTDVCNKSKSIKTLTVSYSVLNDSESSTQNSVASLKDGLISRPRTRTGSKASYRLRSSKKADDTDDVFENTSRSSVLMVSQLSVPKSSSISSQNRLKLLSRYENKPPQKVSLPTLLSMGIGSLQNPKEFQYRGITYAPWSNQNHSCKVPNTIVVSSHKEDHDKENKITNDDNREVMHSILINKSKRLQKPVPFEVRMQNLFTEVDKLVDKTDNKNGNQLNLLQNLVQEQTMTGT